MKLKEGKYYRTAEGRKVGPMLYENDIWRQDGCEQIWYGDGTVMAENGDESHDYIIAEWVDHCHVSDRSEFKPKPWRDMTPEEKGALLLAHHEGEVIVARLKEGPWLLAENPSWQNDYTYRIRPPEPKRETVEVCGGVDRDYHGDPHFFHYPEAAQTHRITFDIVDGEPDCASIRMEKL